MENVINILGLNIANIKKDDYAKIISKMLENNGLSRIITLNPEIVLSAIKDEEYFYIINNAELVTADGIGLKFAGLLYGVNLPRMTGVSLCEIILEACVHNQKKALIVNWNYGMSANLDIENALKNKYPGLKFLVHDMPREKAIWKTILNDQKIVNFKPDVLLCLFGAPYQEKFIHHIAGKFMSIKLAIGVGGAFDFFTGKIKRAPKVMQIIGLEWLWRLFKQPKRWKRIINAVIIFPYKFIRWRFFLPHFYRKNVACLVYKKDQGKRMVLLVEREDCRGYWQLPQGGTDGEKLEIAGKRELSEELGCEKFKPISVHKNLYKYKFGQRDENQEYIKRVQKHLGYKGQSQSLYIAEFTGTDDDIKINFWEHTNWKWVPEENVLDTVHECRKPAMKIYLDIFSKINN